VRALIADFSCFFALPNTHAHTHTHTHTQFKVGFKKRARLPSKLEPNDLRALSDKYADLYSKSPVSGRSIPVNISPYNISDEIPDEQEIVKALHRLW
jgi:hypothetical protein